MAKRLYVGNLKYSATSADLQQLFEQFGEVSSAQVLSDRQTARSRGFGFVEMPNDHEAMAAIEGLDGKDHDGRRLNVNEARPRSNEGDGGHRGGGYRGGAGGHVAGGEGGYRGGGGPQGGGGYGANY
jgi:RNA recognition motif-containing protein